MSQLNNKCESSLTCFEALPSALRRNNSERLRERVLFACACICGSRLMRDHLEEIGFGTTRRRTALCCTRSLRKVKTERRRKADLSYIYLFHFPEVSCGAVVWIKVSNPSFLSQIIKGLFVSFLSPWHSVKGKWQYSQLSSTEEWFVLAAAI